MTTQWNHLQVLPSWNASFGVGTAGRAPCSPMKHTKCFEIAVICNALPATKLQNANSAASWL